MNYYSPMFHELQNQLPQPEQQRTASLLTMLFEQREDLRTRFAQYGNLAEWLALKWIHHNGCKEYTLLAELPLDALGDTPAIKDAAQKAHAQRLKPAENGLAITLLIKATAEMFYLNDGQSIDEHEENDLLHWFYAEAVGRYALYDLLTEQEKALYTEPLAGADEWCGLAPTKAIEMVHRWRSRFDDTLADAWDDPAFLAWFYTRGINEHKLFSFLDHQVQQRLASPINGQHAGGVNGYLQLIWHSRGDLQQHFNLQTAEGCAAFMAWFAQHGMKEYHPLPALVPQGLRAETTLQHPTSPESGLAPGITLIGYAYGELGIGEDVRMAAESCRHNGISHSIFNIAPGEEVRQQDRRYHTSVCDQAQHQVNLFCLTAFETFRAIAIHGSGLTKGRYNIGYWPWELPHWPDLWQGAFDLVDEIWTSSRFIYQALAMRSPVPVLHMPMAVSVNVSKTSPSRSNFNLPDNAFLFLFSFDFLSHLPRKNPMATVRAFLKAFPDKQTPVGLVIKSMNANPDSPVWQEFCALTQDDPRIYLINEVLDRSRLSELMQCCDAFVSLHRSEGFGRAPAEAMLFGKPVIATGFSGNADYTKPETACPVDFTTVPLQPDDYLYPQGQYWAEPDSDHAAYYMRKLFDDANFRQQIAAAGQAYVQTHYNPSVVGSAYRQRLSYLSLL